MTGISVCTTVAKWLISEIPVSGISECASVAKWLISGIHVSGISVGTTLT